MPSPFPGMDPFLEHPDHFPTLHGSLVFCIQEALQPLLPEPYYAKMNQRVWLELSRRYVEPDVNVLRAERPTGDPGRGAAVATAAPTEPVRVTVPLEEFQETFVEIYTRHGADKRLVTSIEVLSLANKTPGRKGRSLYLSKQKGLLEGQVNLVEIDLLRGGEHAAAVPRELAVETAGPFDYHVSVHPFDSLEDYYVYPIRLAARLPTVAIPLLPGDPTVPLDLQSIFNRCYDAGPYRREVPYQPDGIVPPLRPDQAAWARTILDAARAERG